jgi:hypothetical protein
MRLLKLTPRLLFALAVSVTGVTVLAVAVALAHEPPLVSGGYRYAGVVENGRGAPAHYIARADGFRFVFFDALSQGRPSERYTLCLGRAGKPAARCWNRTARFGLGRLVFSVTLPSGIPSGALTARWMIESRTVATWRFFHGP